MRVRNGFVSNSSSSSFIVAFPLIPSTIQEVHKLLFGNVKAINIYGDDISTKQMAKIVFEDMKEDGFVSEKEIIEEVKSGWFPGHPDLNFDWQDDKATEEYYEKCDKEGEKLAKKFIAANKDSHFFMFHYSDNDGPVYSTMEHGDIFSKIPNLRISHH
jgi:hypothetical protein